MNNIEKVNKVHPNGWCVKSFPKVVRDLNKCYELELKGTLRFYGVVDNSFFYEQHSHSTIITEQEYLAIVGDVDYGGVRFTNSDNETYTIIKDKNEKYTWGWGVSFYGKSYIQEQFACGDWKKILEPIAEPTPEKTPLELIEKRVAALEVAQVKPKVTEDWKNVSCLSYDDIMRIAKLCSDSKFYSNNRVDLQILESTIKQKLSL